MTHNPAKYVLGLAILVASVVAAAAKIDRTCIRDMREMFGSLAVAKRQCNPKNFVTNPNEYGWERVPEKCEAYRVKGSGATRKRDAVCE